MCSSSHCRRTDSSEVFFRIKLRDGLPDCAKAILKEITFDRQLTNGFQHLVPLLLDCGLLSLCFPLCFAPLFEHAGRMLQKFRFPVAEHVGIQVVFCGNGPQFPLPTEHLQDQLCFEFRCILSS